ncbi:hypothetical protein HMPREF3167_06220 [Trueperella sp. HMSC08B05]|uniref:hypothetical protein n=1 Tax=Trueperella sp. HMSC08B05 TaxID=1581135 RepID=UPI0008A4B232|nr:hypothetical protein [Trueperella sp. HMSC08B05]OFS73877.1 hypothetical protein HMPREF3167_06220 [Trueperella sp. HMSC08B05]
MISHQHAELRVATPTNEPYEWRHPGDRFNGKIMPNRGWRDMDCWLREDLHSQAASLGAQRFKTVSLLAEVDKLLTRASNGELSQTFPDDVAPSNPKDSGRTALIPDIMFLRVPEPFYLAAHRCRIRVYYVEPDATSLLVSLGGLIKNVDATTPQEQNAFICFCEERKRRRFR